MIDSETDNQPTGGTDSTQPSTDIDNPANWDFYDPDEEKQDNIAPAKATGTEGETAASDEVTQEAEAATQEAPEQEAAETEGEAKADPKVLKAADDMLIELADGSTMTVKEARNIKTFKAEATRMRQEDSRRANYIQSITERVNSFIQSQIPPPPELALAYSNPQEYAAQLAQHDAGRRQWEEVMKISDEAKQVTQQFTAEQHQEVLDTENAMLVAKLPRLADEKTRNEFMTKALDVAKLAGVSEQEMRSFTDHRYFVVLDYAIKGLAAEKARQVAAQKVAQVPPVAPPKRQAPQNPAVFKNRDAMQKLTRSGSLRDAMNVDFD